MNNIKYIPQMESICERINNPVKLVQCTALFNEIDFTRSAVLGLYNQMDKIIVVEGSVGNRPLSTSDGHSTDGTLELLEKIKKEEDPENKIVVIKLKRPWKSLEEQKSVFLDLTSPGDFLVILDADEAYHPHDIDAVRRFLDLTPHCTEVIPVFKHYYRDWKHLAAPGPEMQPTHQRIVKRMMGDRYNSHPVITRQDGSCSYFSPWIQNTRFMLNTIFIHHAGHARSTDMDSVMRDKLSYYNSELVKHGNAHLKFKEKADIWLNKKEDPNLFLKISESSDLPECWKNHPMFNFIDPHFASLDTQMIEWDQNIFYNKYVNREPVGTIPLCMNRISQPFMSFYDNRVYNGE